jgi:pimeloyl-ACP methyl ester carboxylesterase
MAFAAYRAPIDFVRPGNTNDEKAAQRSVFVSINSVQSGTQPDLEIKLVRPPVVFLHGVNSNGRVWSNFTPIINKKNIYSLNVINYGLPLAKIYSVCADCPPEFDTSHIGTITPATDPNTETLIKESMLQSSLGFAYNARFVLDKINLILDNSSGALFRAGNNPVGIPVASTQVDVVAHSMGGLVARTMPSIPSYANSKNYGKGRLHKLITIGTPHLGSPLAINILKDENRCIREGFVKNWAEKSIDIQSVVLIENNQTSLVSGGTGDLAGIGIKTTGSAVTVQPSKALRSLDSSIPLALIAGDMGNQIDSYRHYHVAPLWISNWCSNDPMSKYYNADHYSELFDTSIFSTTPLLKTSPLSDAIVPLTSALNSDVDITGAYAYETFYPGQSDFSGLQIRDGGKIFENTVHGEGTLNLGFPGPFLLEQQTTIPGYTETLLNTPVTDSLYHRNYGRF